MLSPLLRPTRTLPAGYRPAGSINLSSLSSNVPALVGLSVAAAVLFLVFAVGFTWVILALRSDLGTFSVSLGSGDLLPGLIVLVLTPVVVLVLHEGVHGLCFWLFTHEWPRYGFKGFYAYAAAPGWHFPRLAYAIVIAAPLALLSLGGLALALVAPPRALPLLFYALTINAAGAIGDILALIWIVISPREALFRDQVDVVERFAPSP